MLSPLLSWLKEIGNHLFSVSGQSSKALSDAGAGRPFLQELSSDQSLMADQRSARIRRMTTAITMSEGGAGAGKRGADGRAAGREVVQQ
jgi:hypothetical protein